MYTEHFGLRQAPFRITPDTRLFFSGGGRGDILDALVYAITSGEGIIKVVGEVGSGKTMLCRMLEERLPEKVEIVYLANPSLSPEHILQAIALEMDLEVSDNANRLQVMHALQQRLLEKHAKNRQVVIFIEEAQSMPTETLEEIRLLSNLETEREKLLQIVLFGQPELDENLDQANIRQLRERITHSFHLQPLSGKALRDYVRFRMRAVGYRGPDVFRPNAYHGLARASEGLTRRINILADKSLLSAFADGRHDVTRKDVQKAVSDSRFGRRRPRLAPQATMALGIVMIAGAAAWTVFDRGQWPERKQAPPARSDAAATGAGPANVQPAADAADRKMVAAAAAGFTSVPASSLKSAPPESAAAMEQGRADASPATGVDEPRSVRVPGPEAPVGAWPTAGSEATPGSLETGETKGQGVAAAVAKMTSTAKTIPEAPSAGESSAAPAPPSPPGDQAAESPNSAAQTRSVTAEIGGGPGALFDWRMEITRQWLRNTNEAHYSIQLLLTSRTQRPQVEAFLKRQVGDDGLQHVYVYETVIDNRPYIGVLYGEFPSLTAAREALENLPGALKRLGPFIRNVRDISIGG